MCGIAGLIDPGASQADREAAVVRMCRCMVHRGPDDSGLESWGDATLGVRRLAIFDPAHGHQPMRTSDGRFIIAFNGAILNFQAIREEVSSAGWAFNTRCDTEVLLAAFSHWGQACTGRLRGMYAFAVWDNAERTLHLARDPFGIKPLYYRQDGKRLFFASEIRALCAADPAAPSVDPASAADFLSWLAVPAPRTLYRDIHQLRPGEQASFRAGRLTIRSGWDFGSIRQTGELCSSRTEFVGELRNRLEDSIRAHMLADVPVGAFLSGGLDSAVIAGMMARATGARLRTFSIGFDEAAFSEAAEAEATARHLGTEHRTRIVTGADAAADIDKFLAACDQPTGDGMNTWYASAAAREGGVTVVLSGLGGDELFGGYPSFRQIPKAEAVLRWWRLLPGPARKLLLRHMEGGDTRRQKAADVLRNARDIHEAAALQRRVSSNPDLRRLLAPDVMRQLEARQPFHPELPGLRADLAHAGALALASAWEMRTYMADVLLRDGDVMSMAHSLELRVPFIDRPLIEWLWGQPEGWRFNPGHPKDVLAEAARDILPPGMAARGKRGFTLPLALWMKRELKPFLDEVFSGASVRKSGLFNSDGVRDAWNGFVVGDDPRGWSRVWNLAILIALVNRRQAPQAPTQPAVVLQSGTKEGNKPPPSALRLPSRAHDRHEGAVRHPKDRIAPKDLRSGTLLMAPEIFRQRGGIARVLQLYLKAICEERSATRRTVGLLSLNEDSLDSTDVRRCSSEPLDDWFVCSGHKRRFFFEALRMSRKCDRVICGHVAQLPVAWLASRLVPGFRYYLVAHGIEVWKPFNMLTRLSLRGAAKILCVSEYTRTEMGRHYRAREGQAIVVPNAVDPYFAIGPGVALKDCPPVIVTTARLLYADRYKGVEHLILAMQTVRAEIPNASLRIIGGGDDLPRLQSVARKCNLLGNGVDFLGPLDDSSLAREIRSCRLFALPSGREGFGIVYLEAMAHGRPCLGARAGGTPEVITDETGILVEFGNVPAIAAGCIAALRHPWQESDILDRVRLFSFDVFKKRLAAIFDS